MEKLVRTEVYALDDEQMGAKLEMALINLGEELETINEHEKLEELEAELMKDFDEYEAHIKETVYELADEIDYDGTVQKAKKIKENVIYFLNQMEVEFRATLGLYQAIKFWKESTDNKIPYAPYETTLKLLGTMKFKGMQQFTDILIINNWFASAHNDYKRDAIYQNFLAEMHNAILKRMEDLDEVTKKTETIE